MLRRKSPFQAPPHLKRCRAAGLKARLEDPGHLFPGDDALGIPGLQGRHLVEPAVGYLREPSLLPPEGHLLLDLGAPGGEVLDQAGIDPLQLEEHP